MGPYDPASNTATLDSIQRALRGAESHLDRISSDAISDPVVEELTTAMHYLLNASLGLLHLVRQTAAEA